LLCGKWTCNTPVVPAPTLASPPTPTLFTNIFDIPILTPSASPPCSAATLASPPTPTLFTNIFDIPFLTPSASLPCSAPTLAHNTTPDQSSPCDKVTDWKQNLSRHYY
jgi:hypothetical protein